MIKRKLNEKYNSTILKLTESYLKNYEFIGHETALLFDTLFEDFKSAKDIFILNDYNDLPDISGEEFFVEALFKDGETHTFLIDKINDKLSVTEVKLTENMLKHKEYL